jgi:DNA/RNA-binding domain of Phe-tRNA-synthetase-like protein
MRIVEPADQQVAFQYAPDLVARFSTVRAGVLLAGGIRNGPAPPALETLLRKREARVRATFDPATLSQHPHIAAWRAAYSAFGVKPARYNSAVELLLRRVLRDGALPRVNAIVDLCNVVSLGHILPVAAWDRDQLPGGVVVRFARDGDHFTRLNAAEDEYPAPGEVVFDASGVLIARRWNWSQANLGKIAPETTSLLIVTEGINDIASAAVEAARDEARQLLRDLLGATVRSALLDAEQRIFV